jgi:hypothetical protein
MKRDIARTCTAGIVAPPFLFLTFVRGALRGGKLIFYNGASQVLKLKRGILKFFQAE